jgi:hypothetical protein
MPNLSCSSDNLSEDGITEELWVLEGEIRTSGLIVAVFLIFFVLVGVPANILVIGSVIKHKLYKQTTFIAILNLAVCSLLIGVLVLPLSIVSGLASSFLLGGSDSTRCQVCKHGTIMTILVFGSTCSVMLISVDRFLFIKYPLRYDKLVSIRGMLFSVIFTWLICIIVGILPVFGFGEIYFSIFIATCTIDFSGSTNYLIILVLVVIAIALVLFLTNMWVLCIAQKHLRKMYLAFKSSSYYDQKQKLLDRSRRHRKQLNLIRMFAVVFFTDIFTWIPVIFLAIVSAVIDLADIPVGYTALSFLFLMSQSVLHPLLGICLVSEIREPILKLLHIRRDSVPESTVHEVENKKCDTLYCCSLLMLPDHELTTEVVLDI